MVRFKRGVAACTLAVLVCWASTAWQQTQQVHPQHPPKVSIELLFGSTGLPFASSIVQLASSTGHGSNSNSSSGGADGAQWLYHLEDR